MRVIRSQADSLLQIDEKELAAMRIGLAHRYSKKKKEFLIENLKNYFLVYLGINLNFLRIKSIQ